MSTEPTLFDDLFGVAVPTYHRDGAEQAAAHRAAMGDNPPLADDDPEEG